MAHISGMRIRIVGFAISYCVVCSFVIRAIDVVGFWSGYIVILGRTGSFELKITTEEKKLTCKIKMVNEPAKVINDLKIEKDTITFSLQTSAQDIPRLEFSGNIEGDKMKLTISGRDRKGGIHEMGKGTLTREKSYFPMTTLKSPCHSPKLSLPKIQSTE